MKGRSKLETFFLLSAVNLALVLILSVAVELVFGDWFAPYLPPTFVIVNRSYVYHQQLYEPSSDVIYSTDKYGLRGVHEPIAEIDLVTVGGSTTNQAYVTEGATWQDVLRSLTGIKVANAGADGMTSFGHIVAVSNWLQKIPGFRPKLYLHYLGVNDASLGLEPRLADQASARTIRSMRRRSVLARGLEILLFSAAGPREVSHSKLVLPNDREMRRATIDTKEIMGFIETVYQPNLRKLLAAHRQHRETAIFVSQPANPAIVAWKDGDTWVSTKYTEYERWAVALGLINRATEVVCREAIEVCRFSNLAGRAAFEPSDFYDLVHNTPSGARKLGAFLAGELACPGGTRVWC